MSGIQDLQMDLKLQCLCHRDDSDRQEKERLLLQRICMERSYFRPLIYTTSPPITQIRNVDNTSQRGLVIHII